MGFYYCFMSVISVSTFRSLCMYSMYLMFNCVLLCFICATLVCERCYINNIYIYIALLEMLFKLFFVLCCSEVAV